MAVSEGFALIKRNREERGGTSGEVCRVVFDKDRAFRMLKKCGEDFHLFHCKVVIFNKDRIEGEELNEISTPE